MALDKLVDSTQLDADLTSVANAIRTKGGTSGSLAFPAGFVSAVEAIETGGGAVDGNVADFINWTPAFDDTWSTVEFDIVSYPSSGIMTLPNPLGVIPTYIVILKTNPTLSDIDGIIGGFNFISGASTDADTNRNIKYIIAGQKSTDLTGFGMFGTIQYNNYNLISTACTINTNQIQFRCGTAKNVYNGFCLGHYIMGVKVV